MNYKRILIGVAIFGVGLVGSYAQTTAVRGRIEVKSVPKTGKDRQEKIPETVVWLMPIPVVGSDANPSAPAPSINTPATARLVQKNKSFVPHVLVVQAGSRVEFPNHDPFFHNVFSLFEGKRFDLGLYEAGTSKVVHFDRPGISYIFCNIHPEMSAVVITLSTPWYAISSANGQLTLPDVPYGRYLLHVWSEGMEPENEQSPAKEITIGENAASLGVIQVPEASGQKIAHKNKYGRDYDDPATSSPVYNQQR